MSLIVYGRFISSSYPLPAITDGEAMIGPQIIKVPPFEAEATERQKKWSRILLLAGAASILSGVVSCTVGGTAEQAEATATSDAQQAAPAEHGNAADKVAPDAVEVMAPADFRQTYAKLGKRAFERANQLAPWAAWAAAQDATCRRVELVGLSDSATRQNLKWFVNCEGDTRIYVDQRGAEKARASEAERPEEN